MKLYPNTSILTLITRTEGENENLLFIHLKPVPDFYPFDTVHWYDGAGKNGKPNSVWDNLSVKQWTACGKDDDIIKLFDEILLSKKLTIGSKEIPLNIPSHELLLHKDDPLKSRSEEITDSFITKNNPLIPQEFYQKENLKFLSGYRTGSTEITPFFPLGFFEDDFIYDNLKRNIWGIKEHRTAYLTFQGVHETSKKGKGSKEIVGFYQQNFNTASEYTAIIRNEADVEIGKSTIDKTNGFFKITLSEPTIRGKAEVFANSVKEKAIDYVFIQDIQVDAQIANTTFNDIYGRHFLITSDKKRPETLSNFTWQQGVYADEKTGNQKLSDLFKEILDYLGPNILIADPYFIGYVKFDTVTNQFLLSPCQQAFINALIHSAIEKGIDQLNILGYKSRAENQFKKDETQGASKAEQLFGNYEKLFKGMIRANKLQNYFKPSSIKILNAGNDFHNRYWFSIKEENGIDVLDKCVIVTNSLGGISKTEVDFVGVTDKAQLEQIIRNRAVLFTNAEQQPKVTI